MKTKAPSYLTSAKTMYAALTILKKNGGSMPIRVLMREIEKTVDLTDWEKRDIRKHRQYPLAKQYALYICRLC